MNTAIFRLVTVKDILEEIVGDSPPPCHLTPGGGSDLAANDGTVIIDGSS